MGGSRSYEIVELVGPSVAGMPLPTLHATVSDFPQVDLEKLLARLTLIHSILVRPLRLTLMLEPFVNFCSHINIIWQIIHRQ